MLKNFGSSYPTIAGGVQILDVLFQFGERLCCILTEIGVEHKPVLADFDKAATVRT